MSKLDRFKAWWKATFTGPVKREQWAWAMYDWAKSPYENAVLGVFLGPFITGLAKQHACNIIDTCSWCAGACLDGINLPVCTDCDDNKWCCSANQGYVYIGNSPISYGSIYAYSISASAVIQVLLLPFVGAFGDSTSKPKFYLLLATIAASIVLILMLTVHSPSLFWLATIFSILGNVLYAMVNVFYNALLVFIASPKEQNSVSALGYAVGYVGGGIVLIIALVYYLFAPSYLTIRVMMAFCGIWWIVFSTITFRRVISNTPRKDLEDYNIPPSRSNSQPERPNIQNKVDENLNNNINPDADIALDDNLSKSNSDSVTNSDSIANSSTELTPNPAIDSLPALSHIVSTSAHEEDNDGTAIKALKQLWKTILMLRRIPATALFLLASAIFNDGISTLSSLAGTYATEALGATFTTLAILALVTNFAGIVGAFFFTWLAKKTGTKYAILLSLLLWCGVVIYGYLVQQLSQLYIIGFLIGVGLGSSQPLSRSLLANMIPKGFENQIFSFYELTQRGTSWIGPLVYASVTDRYHNNPRPGLISIIAFFVIGGVLLFFVDTEKGIREAKIISKETEPKQPAKA